MNDAVRRALAKTLGAFWLLDGLLQLQPQMFGANFVTQVLQPVLSGQPGFIDAIVDWGIRLWNFDRVASDSASAVLEIALGVALLAVAPTRKTFKVVLWASIAWSVLVWLCGEGAGQMLTGTATFYTGAPGSVVIYGLLAALLLMSDRVSVDQYPKIAGWLCVLGFLLQLQPLFWTASGVGSNFSATTDPVRALSRLPSLFGKAIDGEPLLANAVLALALLAVGLALILEPNRITGIIALAFLVFVWWFGQDFGQLSTVASGTATDPDTAPLIALLLVPIFVGARQRRRKTASFVAAD